MEEARAVIARAEGIRFERNGTLGVVVLDRQRALNALTRGMIQALSLKLLEWRDDPSVAAVLVKAAPGRAFCAGGDIRWIHEAATTGRAAEAIAFYREEYRLNWRIFRYPKPYIALLDGITLGGGAGISVHGSHRVVTENVSFAMPEVGIGFFPDVGATYFLPRCAGELGPYLGLTGARIGAADCLYAGIGTQFVPADGLPALEGALSTLEPGAAAGDVDARIAGLATPSGGGVAPLDELRETIDECFAGESLATVVAALEREPSGAGEAIMEQLRGRSPISLEVTFNQLRKGGACLSFEEAMQLEFRLAHHFLGSDDFYEGVRAAVIDKDRRPRWTYPEIGSVPQDAVDAFFASLDGEELTLDWQGL